MGCSPVGPLRDFEEFISNPPWTRSSSPPGEEVAVGEHLTQVGGPGALLGTDLEKLQSQASPLTSHRK